MKRKKIAATFVILTLIGAVQFFAYSSHAQSTGSTGQVMTQLFASLLQGLLQLTSGGNTPQTGSSDEQVPIPATINTTQTGSRGTNSTGGTSLNNTLGSKSFFLYKEAGVYVIKPNSQNISLNEKVNYFNATSESQKVIVRDTSSVQAKSEVTILPNSVHIFLFSTKGNYKLCLSGSSPEICVPVNVQ